MYLLLLQTISCQEHDVAEFAYMKHKDSNIIFLSSSLLSMVKMPTGNQRYLLFLTLLLRENGFYRFVCETGRLC